MTHFLVQHALQGKTLAAEDRFVNTFHLDSTATVLIEATFDTIANAIELFYTSQQVGLSEFGRGIGRTIKIYNMGLPTPRAPLYERVSDTAPYIAPASSSLPEEVAICLSYEGLQVSGSPPGRRRGRIYVGPWNVGIIQNNSDGSCKVHSATVGSLLNAALELKADLAAADCPWKIWSGRDAAFVDIATFRVDNAFDTQRRRGRDATIVEIRDADSAPI